MVRQVTSSHAGSDAGSGSHRLDQVRSGQVDDVTLPERMLRGVDMMYTV